MISTITSLVLSLGVQALPDPPSHVNPCEYYQAYNWPAWRDALMSFALATPCSGPRIEYYNCHKFMVTCYVEPDCINATILVDYQNCLSAYDLARNAELCVCWTEHLSEINVGDFSGYDECAKNTNNFYDALMLSCLDAAVATAKATCCSTDDCIVVILD